VLCCAGAAIEKESFYISKQEEEKPFKPLLVSPAHIILMRPPLVPYNPVITLTWTFSFFWVLFSPSTPVILRLLTSFSFLFLNSGGTSRLLIHTRIHRDAGGDDPQAPRVDISTAAAPFLVYSQLLRHYFSREAPGIFAANSSSTASTILLLLQTTTTQHLFGIHPSIHLVQESAE
jgi:hypothetical protein